MEGPRQPQGQQGLTLAALAQLLPASRGGGPLQAFEAEVGREVPMARLAQGIRAGLLILVRHQRAGRPLEAVITASLQGVVHHQQHPLRQGRGGGRQPGLQTRMQLTAPSRRASWGQPRSRPRSCQVQGL